jgi:hypothetical protein
MERATSTSLDDVFSKLFNPLAFFCFVLALVQENDAIDAESN